MTVMERIQRGAALLDREQPGWVDRINLDTLNIRQSHLCVTGQLKWGADIPVTEAIGYGFYTNHTDASAEAWEELTAKWRKLITERRDAT